MSMTESKLETPSLYPKIQILQNVFFEAVWSCVHIFSDKKLNHKKDAHKMH